MMDDNENRESAQSPAGGSQQPQPYSSPPPGNRWALFRDVFKFQAKLVVDGLRDALMIPVSLVAAVVGVLMEPKSPDRLFNKVLDFGRKTESWINLFGRAEREPGIDELFGRLEQRIKDQYEKGGITASAKDTIDLSLDRLNDGVGKLRQRLADEVAARQESNRRDD